MKKLHALLVLFMVLILTGCNISGVITKDGVGLQGVTIQVEKNDVVVGTTVTEEDGSYSIDVGDEGGTYVVTPLGLYAFTPEQRTVAVVNDDVSGVDFTASCKMWNKTYGENVGRSIQQTNDGGYIIAGETWFYSPGQEDAWLIKIDADGNEEWDKTFGGDNSDFANSVKQTADGGYILAGGRYSYETHSEFLDVLLIKTDANGNEEWSKTIYASKEDRANTIQQTKDGGYIIAGYTYSYGAGYNDAWLIKTDANGTLVWRKTFGGFLYDYAGTVQQTTDGGYIFAGTTSSYGDNINNAWLLKTDADGNQEWSKTFGGSSHASAYSVQQTEDGGYILCGDIYPYGNNESYAWVIKTDANGNEEWDKTIGETDTNRANTVRQTTDGGYVISGSTWWDDYNNAWLLKTDEQGNTEWNQIFYGDNWAFCMATLQTTDGGYILLGAMGYPNLWLVKTDENGNTTPLQ